MEARKKELLKEVLEDAVADGLVVPRAAGKGYFLTPRGGAWLREFPRDLLVCYPDRRQCVGRA